MASSSVQQGRKVCFAGIHLLQVRRLLTEKQAAHDAS